MRWLWWLLLLGTGVLLAGCIDGPNETCNVVGSYGACKGTNYRFSSRYVKFVDSKTGHSGDRVSVQVDVSVDLGDVAVELDTVGGKVQTTASSGRPASLSGDVTLRKSGFLFFAETVGFPVVFWGSG